MKLGVFVSDYSFSSDILDRMGAGKFGLILVQNGVYHALLKDKGKESPLLSKASEIYVLGDDVETRGFAKDAVDKRVKVVDYGGLVDVIFNDFEKIAWL